MTDLELYVELVGRISLGALAVLVVGLLLRAVRSRIPPSWRTKVGRLSRTLSLQFAESVTDVESAVGNLGDPRRRKVTAFLTADYAFIPVYAAVLAALGVLLAWRSDWDPSSWYLWAGAAATAMAVVTANVDARENVRTDRVLAREIADTTRELVDEMRRAAIGKWVAAVITTALLIPLFWGDGRDDLVGWLFWVWIVAAAIGVAGLAFYPLLPLFLLVLVVAVGLTLAFFAIRPDDFLRNF